MIVAAYVLYILNCMFLILVVLLQAGKGDGMGAMFGGGGSNTLLGNRGAATFLSKLTVGSAILFMLLSILLALQSSTPGSRVGRGRVNPENVPGVGAVAPVTEGDDEEADESSTPRESDEAAATHEAPADGSDDELAAPTETDQPPADDSDAAAAPTETEQPPADDSAEAAVPTETDQPPATDSDQAPVETDEAPAETDQPPAETESRPD